MIMEERLLDDFEDLSGWSPIASGSAQLTLSPDQGLEGKAMRLDFDFHGGGGFVVARKPFPLEMPESYSFGFRIRGSGPPNIFEFKLIDASNRNVWRYRVEEFALPEEWRPVRIRDSQIEFAWGPIGGGPARHVAAIEIVIAAGPGGRGSVWIEGFSFRDDTYRLTPVVQASSTLPGHDPQNVVDLPRPSCWRSEPSDPQWLLVDFLQEREYGGVVIHWEKHLAARRFELHVSLDGLSWRNVYSTRQGGGERSYLFLPSTASRHIRIDLQESVEGRGFGIRSIEVRPHEFSRSLNHFFQAVASETPAGLYPKYLLGRQSYWTIVGTGEGEGQALFNEEGMVEVGKGSFSIAPFLYADGRLITWADVKIRQELSRGSLPIPSSVWKADGLSLRITAFAAAAHGRQVLYIRYRVHNRGNQARPVYLFAAILPFQVTPTWQNWRSFGGVTSIREISWGNGVVLVNGNKAVIPLMEPSGFGAAPFAEGGVTGTLPEGGLPGRAHVEDEFGHASGALRFDLAMAPRSSKEVCLAVPSGPLPPLEGVRSVLPSGSVRAQYNQAVRTWETRLGTVDILLPSRAKAVAETFRTAAAHILINREGSALHPGPRRYSRSWIRDGAIMGAALLRVGETTPMRDFIRWYRKHQAEDGNIPDCADDEGTEWLPEFDAYGQFVYAVMEYYRFTRDTAFLAEMRPFCAKTLGFMEGLRNRRLTPEYRSPEKRGCYGLLPESMSHEGYMAHPVHAYWDDFWGIRGFRDGAAMAGVLGDRKESERLSALAQAFSEDLRTSLSMAIARHQIDFIPGSVEFGDFDPTATAVAIGLLDQLHLLPAKETRRTFEKYMEGFRGRASGSVDWNNYSAYEIRVIGALIRLGRREDAMEVTRFMLKDRRIRAWNQWPEISWRDPSGPSFLGDLPHTWISGEYIVSIRSMFAYEQEADESLVIGAGVDWDWLSDGSEVGVENLPTHYGRISYRMRLEGDSALRLSLRFDSAIPKGGIVVRPPLPRPILKVDVDGRRKDEFTKEEFTLRECPAEVVVRF